MATTLLTMTQSGYAAAGTWNDLVAPTFWLGNIGVDIDTGVRLSQASALDGQLITDFTLTGTAFSSITGTLTIKVDTDLSSEAFTTASPPQDRRFPSDPPNIYQQEVSFTATEATTIDLGEAIGWLRHSDLSTLGLHMTLSGGNFQALTGVTVTVTHQDEFTGLSGVSGTPIPRADRCPKTGKLGLRETWVRDGYTNTMVDPLGYDPPDHTEYPLTESPEQEPVGEG